jgi:hypothetical protein
MSHFIHCYAECHYAECHYAEYRYAECRYSEYHYAECHYTESHYAECRYSDCHYAECHYAECRGARWHSTEGAFFEMAIKILAYCKSFLRRKQIGCEIFTALNSQNPTLQNFTGQPVL